MSLFDKKDVVLIELKNTFKLLNVDNGFFEYGADKDKYNKQHMYEIAEFYNMTIVREFIL